MSDPVSEGVLQWKKKKGVEKRFFVLYPDRIEYFSDAKDRDAGQDARGCFALTDIQSFNVTADGFRICVAGRDQDFVTEDSAAQRFAEELGRLVEPDREAQSSKVADTTGGEEASFSTSPVTMTQSPASLSALSPTRPFTPAAQEAADAWPASPTATSEASPTASGGVSHAQPNAAATSSPTADDTQQQPAATEQTVDEREPSTAPTAVPTASGQAVTGSGQAPQERTESPSSASATAQAQTPWGSSGAPICSGHLNVERKNRMVQRYFALLPDRLHYFEDQQKAIDGQEPRGFILLRDVVFFEEKEDGFVIQSRNEEKALELFCSSAEERATWVAAWSKVIKQQLGKSFVVRQQKQAEQAAAATNSDLNAGVIQQGMLELIKEKKSEQRHFVLLANRFEYYNSAEDFAAGVKPRGQVAIQDVRTFEVTGGGVMIATLAERAIRLRAPSPEAAKSWGESWAKALQDVGGQVVWSQPGADSSGGQVAPMTEAATSDPARTTEESKVPAIPLQEDAPQAPQREARPEGSSLLWQGRFDLEDSSHPEGELVLFVIFQDYMEYFLRPDPEASWNSVAGQEPARRIMLQEIGDLEVLDTGFNLALRNGTSFRLRAKDTASLNQCVEAFSKALAEEERQPRLQIEARGGGEVPSTVTTTTPGSSYSGTSTPTGWPVQEGAGPHPDLHHVADGDNKRSSRCPSRTSLRQVSLQTTEPILQQGPLLVQKQRHQEGQVAARPEVLHVVVFRDRFEYYADKASMASGAAPQGQVRVSNVVQVRVQDAGFVLGMGNEGLNLRIPSGQDMQAWMTALWAVFDPDRLTQGADAGAGTAAGPSRSAGSKQKPAQAEEEPAEASRISNRKSGSLWSKTDRLPERPVSAAELLQEAADSRVEQWLAALRDPPCQSGVLGFQTRGKMVMRYAVMFEDRIDIWDGALMAAAGRKPSDRVALRSIRGVEAVFGGFILNCGGKRIGVHVSSNDELRSWSTALLGVITSVAPQPPPSAAGSTRSQSHSAGKDDSTAHPKTQRAHSAGWVPRVATLAAKNKGEGDSPARKTYFTSRSQGKCFNIKTHKASAELGEGLHGPYAKVMTHAGQPGGRHISQDVTGKVNEGAAKTPRVARSVVAENSLTHKVTGTSPVCSPRQEVGSLTWVKVTHAEATPPPKSARSPMEVRRSPSPPYFVDRSSNAPQASSPMTSRTAMSHHSPTAAAAASAASPKLRRTSSAPVTAKVNQVQWGGGEAAGRPRPQQPSLCRHMVGKITDPGRQRSGWAQPTRPASVDKVRGIAEKSQPGTITR